MSVLRPHARQVCQAWRKVQDGARSMEPSPGTALSAETQEGCAVT